MSEQTEPKKEDQESPLKQMSLCKECRQEIMTGAKRCHHCGASQRGWSWLNHTPVLISLVMMGVAIVQALVGYNQLLEAQRQRILASNALEKAEEAQSTAHSASTEVEKLSQQAKKQVTEIKSLVDDAKQSLDSIKSLSEFSLILLKARNDDRSAFDVLREIAKKQEHRFYSIANQALIQIVTDPQVTGLLDYQIDWQKEHNIDPAKASMKDFTSVFNKEISIRQPNVLVDMWKQERFSKSEKLQTIYEVITTTSSLRVLRQACQLIDAEAHLNKNIIAYDLFIEWWRKNKASYQEKLKPQPTGSFDKK